MIKFIKPKKYQRSIFFILTAILIVFMAGVIIGPLGVIKITSSLAVLIIIPFFVSFVANIFYQWYLKNRAKITKVKPFPKWIYIPIVIIVFVLIGILLTYPILHKWRILRSIHFDNEKIKILTATFVNEEGNQTTEGSQCSATIMHDLENIIYKENIIDIVEVKKIPFEANINIDNHNKAKKIAKTIGADILIWGYHYACYPTAPQASLHYPRASILHPSSYISEIRGSKQFGIDVLSKELADLISSETLNLLQFIIGYTYLIDKKHKNYLKSSIFLEKAYDELSIKDENKANIGAYLGEANWRAGKWKKAIEVYYNCINFYEEKGGDEKVVASLYNKIGLVYQWKSDFSKGLEYHKKAEKQFTELNDQFGLAQTLGNIGIVYWRKGDFEKALKYYEKSITIKQEIKDMKGISETLGNEGLVYSDKGEWAIAIQKYEESIKISKKLKEHRNTATSYLNLGIVYFKQGKFDEAIEFYKKAENIFLRLGSEMELAGTVVNIGILYLTKGDLDNALKYLKKGQKKLQEINDKLRSAYIETNIALIHSKKGDIDTAIEFYKSTEKTFISFNKKYELARIYANLAGVYLLKGEFEQTIRYYSKAEKIFQETDDKQGLAIGNLLKGEVYLNKNDLDKALKYCEEAYLMLQKIGDKINLPSVFICMGKIYFKKINLELALKYYKKSEEICLETGDQYNLALAYIKIGEVYAHKDDIKNVQDYFVKAEDILLKIGDKYNLSYIKFYMGKILLKLGKKEQSKKLLQQALDYFKKTGRLYIDEIEFALKQCDI